MGPPRRDNTVLTIRRSGPTDLPCILALYTQAGMDGGAPLAIDEAERLFARIQRYPCYEIYVAERNLDPVGTFALLVMDNLGNRGRPSGIIEDVAVRPTEQRLGIGQRMIEFALSRCRELGCYKLALSTNLRRTSAHRFYESLGFERHGYSYVIDLAAEIPSGR
jgi:GNAT superfamily N-acetyltransferase